jgi:hypothetical protein
VTFATALFDEIVARYQLAGGTVPLYFAQPSGPSRPFAVMLIVPPNVELPTELCADQGDGGELRIQMSLAADSPIDSYSQLEAIKDVVQDLRGVIGTAPDQYRIYGNDTQGVVNQDAALGGWSSIFEAIFMWDKETP